MGSTATRTIHKSAWVPFSLSALLFRNSPDVRRWAETLIIEPFNMETSMSDEKDGAAVNGLGYFVLIIIALFLAFTNPTEFEVRRQIVVDGWVPLGYERTNLLVFSYARITGFTGAKAIYIGVGGNVFQLGGGN